MIKYVAPFIFLINQANAKLDRSMCRSENKSIIKRITPKGNPNYFFKASPDGKYIYYISANKNYRLDTETGEELLIPGGADPVPSADGKLMTSINWMVRGVQSWSLNLMPMKDWDIIRNNDKSPDLTKVVLDRNTTRTYQSVGTLENGKYRVLSMDESQYPSKLLVKDYSLNGLKITSTQEYDYPIEIDEHRLPMISKDGKELGILDLRTNQTVIYKFINDGKQIEEVDRLDYPSGKVDFSSDGKKITFHVSETVNKYQQNLGSSETALPPIFKDNAEVRNVFVYDRESKSVTPVTQNESGNSYFPIFLENGNVIYLDQRKGQKLSFVISKVPEIAPRSIERARACYRGSSFDDNLEQLAKKWRNVCTDWEGSDTGASKVMMLNIPYAFCKQIAYTSSNKELVKVCKALKDSEIKKPVVRVSKNPVEKMLKVKCAICHGDNIPFSNKEKLKSYKDEILKRVNSIDDNYRMPRGGHLSKKEKSELSDYLNTL